MLRPRARPALTRALPAGADVPEQAGDPAVSTAGGAARAPSGSPSSLSVPTGVHLCRGEPARLREGAARCRSPARPSPAAGASAGTGLRVPPVARGAGRAGAGCGAGRRQLLPPAVPALGRPARPVPLPAPAAGVPGAAAQALPVRDPPVWFCAAGRSCGERAVRSAQPWAASHATEHLWFLPLQVPTRGSVRCCQRRRG